MFQPIELNVFEERTGISSATDHVSWQSAAKIVSFRDIVSVSSIQVMPEEYLRKLLRNTTLVGCDGERIYKNCDISRARVDPHNLLVGQTFVEKEKIGKMLENLSKAFEGFCVNHGFAKSIPFVVLGKLSDGSFAIAHYIPPIVEQHNGGLCLLDGVHRNFLIGAVGTTIEAIILKNISAPFPCDVKAWSSLRLVDKKPPKEERFYNLQTDLFRDLKWVGIDG
jgi:hypothetical protein